MSPSGLSIAPIGAIATLPRLRARVYVLYARFVRVERPQGNALIVSIGPIGPIYRPYRPCLSDLSGLSPLAELLVGNYGASSGPRPVL